jgi:hypothetical protein
VRGAGTAARVCPRPRANPGGPRSGLVLEGRGGEVRLIRRAEMKSSLRKLRGFALQRHEQRVDRHRDHSTTAAKAADELLAAAQVRRRCLSLPFLRCRGECAARVGERGGRSLSLSRGRGGWESLVSRRACVSRVGRRESG